MSLTRKEWEELWSAIKAIENNGQPKVRVFKTIYDKNVKLIKDKVQQVIGQME